MSKKDLARVTTDLSALASALPTQRPAAVVEAHVADRPAPKETPSTKSADEEITQFSLSLRKDLRKQLSRLADDADMTMRAFVLNALKAQGLSVRDDDIADHRKDRR